MKKNNPIVVVTGLSRCGSSLMMQMLHAGGMPVSCAPGNEKISGEHNSNTEALKLIALDMVNGKAIKALDPLNFPLPPGKDYVFIWCRRNFQEQAKSIVKFLRELGIKASKSDANALHKSLHPDTIKSLRYLENLGPVHVFEYEEVIAAPTVTACRIAKIFDEYCVLDVAAMRSVVIDRSPKCFNGFMETILIERANIE